MVPVQSPWWPVKGKTLLGMLQTWSITLQEACPPGVSFVQREESFKYRGCSVRCEFEELEGSWTVYGMELRERRSRHFDFENCDTGSVIEVKCPSFL
jgi:hypothetical protein